MAEIYITLYANDCKGIEDYLRGVLDMGVLLWKAILHVYNLLTHANEAFLECGWQRLFCEIRCLSDINNMDQVFPWKLKKGSSLD